MDRRAFLKAGLLAGAALGVGACARGREPVLAPAPLRDVASEVAARAEPGLNVFAGQRALTASGSTRLTFGLTVDASNAPIEGKPASVWLATGGQRPVRRAARWRTYAQPGANDPRGFYTVEVPVPDARIADVMVEAGGRYGFAAVPVLTCEPDCDDVEPRPGSKALRIATPTRANRRGVGNLCTREPVCSMHELSLDRALAQRIPIVFSIASPKLCTSRTCGPVLEEVLAVRAANRGALYVHAEPYKGDEATILSPTARAWRLQSEPWTYVIDRDGTVAAAFEGPVVADEIAAVLRPLVA